MTIADYRRPGLTLPGRCEDWADSAEFIRETLDRVGGKWMMSVLATMVDGPVRYSDFRLRIPNLSQRMLTRTLKMLLRDGLVSRTSRPDVPPRVEYDLTAMGTGLLEALRPLSEWATMHQRNV